MLEDSTTDKSVGLTEAAAARIAALIEMEGDETLMLRLQISGGGCAGFSYGFSLESTQNADDLLFERDGVKMVVDPVSLDLLAGAEVDYVEDLMGASFRVNNPNASSSCGCGTSFGI